MKTIFATIILFLSLTLNAASMQEEVDAINAEFAAYKQNQNSAFSDYKERLDKEFQEYKKELDKYWEDPKLSTKKAWVSYSQDKKSRSNVDFENNVITIETVAKNEEEAKKELEKRLGYAVSKNTEEVIQSDPLQQRIQKLSESVEEAPLLEDAQPILATVIFNKEPNKQELQQYTNRVVNSTPLQVKSSKLPQENLYRLTVALPSDTRLKRSKIYAPDVMRNAKRFELPASLIFAVMHTESDFNPMATSHIPAFGLMQIVPSSAGRDVYQFLYNKKGMPTPSYLYNGKNNIEIGSSYLHILYYRYLKKIKNPQSRLYCSIAAYNTGAGNIAWAFTGEYNVAQATSKINALTPDEVYTHLMNHLRYDEPKHYLKNVKQRMGSYKQAYSL